MHTWTCTHYSIHAIYFLKKFSCIYLSRKHGHTKKKACPCLNMDASDTAACVSIENNNNNFLNFGHGQDMMAKKKKSTPENYTGLVIPDELGCFSRISSSMGLAETPPLRASAISSPTFFRSGRPRWSSTSTSTKTLL